MLLYLRTSKGDINTQNTGNRAGTLIDWHSRTLPVGVSRFIRALYNQKIAI